MANYSGIFEDRSRRLITRPLFGTLRRQNDRSRRDSRNLIDLCRKMCGQHCDGRCPNPSIHEYVSSCNGPSRIDPRGSLPSCIDPQGSLESRTQISGQSTPTRGAVLQSLAPKAPQQQRQNEESARVPRSAKDRPCAAISPAPKIP